ncbi:DUF7507 domain-containing protein, partial [Pedobacter africanus]
ATTPGGTGLTPVLSDDPAKPGTADPTVIAIAANAGLSLSKVATNTGSKAGDVINYSMVLSNTGNVTLSNVTVSDAGADAGSISPAAIASLAPGASATVTASHTLSQAEVNAGSYSNQASVLGSTPGGTTLTPVLSDDPNTTAVQDATHITILPRGSLSLSKAAGNTGNKAGDVINYTLVVKNTGNVTLTDIHVDDAGADAGSVNPATIASLAPNASATVTASYTLTQADVDAGNYANQAGAKGKMPDGSVLNAVVSDNPATPAPDDATVILIAPAAQLNLTKVASNTGSKAGDVINYSMVVSNTGNVTLSNVTVSDAGADAGSISPAVITSLAPGASATITASHTLSQAEINAGSYSNQASVAATTPGGTRLTPVLSDDPGKPGTADPTVIAIAANAGLSLSKVATNTGSKAGDVLNYSMMLSNTGNVTLSNVTVTDAGADAGSISPAAIASLAPGAMVTVTASHTLSQAEVNAGSYSNQARVLGSTPGGTTLTPILSDNPNTPAPNDATLSLIAADARMALTKIADNTGSKAGDVINYTLVVSNTGNVTLSNVALTDAGADAGSISPASIASLAPGASITVKARHTLSQAEVNAGSYSNQARVTALTPGGITMPPVSSDDPATPGSEDPTVISIARNGSLTLTKAANNTGSRAGDVINYTLLVTNTGNVTLANIVVTDAGADAGSILPASIAALAPGASATLTASHTLSQAEVNAGRYSNQASATATTFGGTALPPVSSDDPATPAPGDATVIGIAASASMRFSKVADHIGTKAGEVISYRLLLTNTGNVTLSAIAVTDPGADAGSIAPGTIASLAPKDSIAVAARHTLTQQDIDNGFYSNQARVTANTPAGTPLAALFSDDPASSAASDPTVTALIQIGSLNFTKAAINTAGKSGDVINYRMVLTNTGNATLNNLRITDAGADAGSINPAIVSTLAPNASATITARHTLSQSDVDAGLFKNQASISGALPNRTALPILRSDDPATTLSGDSTTSLIGTKAMLTLVKTAVLTGNTISYTFTIKNTGNVSLHNVTLTDAKLGISNRPVNVGTALVPGAAVNVTELYNVTPADNNAGIVTNTATVRALTLSAQVLTDISGTAEDNDLPTSTNVNNASLTLLKSGPSNAAAAENIVYTLQIDNRGVADATGVTIRDLVPAELKSVNWGSVVNGGAVISSGASGNVNDVQLRANIPAGAGITVTITGKTDASFSGKLLNVATLTTAVPGSPVVTTAPVETQVSRKPVLAITKTGPQTAKSGDLVTYLVEVSNNGIGDALALAINDRLSNELVNASWTSNATGEAKVLSGASGSGNSVSILADLPAGPGNKVTLTITGTVLKSFTGKIVNTASAVPSEGLPEVLSNTVETVVAVSDFVIPNIITPNNDGDNDTFKIKGLENYPGTQVLVFNRWGNEVYRSNNYTNDWDGSQLNEGTYYYLVNRKEKSGTVTVFKGWLFIKR